MIEITTNVLMLKKNIKEFEKALSKADKKQLKALSNVLVMNIENLSLEVSHYVNKS